MKNQKWIKFAFIALLSGVILQSCSKEDELVPVSDQPNWSVRPDFATIDNRPAEVIVNFIVTEKDAEPVKLMENSVKGAKYAVVIGISDYSGTANDLQYCDDDATDWKAYLQSQGYSVTILLDRTATKAAIETAINTLASQSIAGNEITFVYSGHGSRGNIISTDLYYIPSTWFKTKFSAATSTKMMFSFDACQIGAMATSLNATGRIIAVASNKTIYSYDGDATMKNGVFTYFQMVGFGQMGYVYAEPDCQYACDQMNVWASANKVRVAPSYVDSYSGNFDF